MKEPSVALAGVNFVKLDITPTENKAKPVIVLNFPFTPTLAEKLGGHWLYDHAENPVLFDGSVKLPLEYSGPIVHMMGSQSKHEIYAQKIVSILVSHGGGEDANKLFCSMRIHMKNVNLTDIPARDKFLSALEFLITLNKAQFDIQIEPSQGTLPGTMGTAENEPVEVEPTDTLHMVSKVGKVLGIDTTITIAPTHGGYNAGWDCRCPGLDNQPAAGEAIKEESQVFERKDSAIAWACGEVLSFINKLETRDKKEENAQNIMRQWCFAQAPGLEKKTESVQ